jgi:hypothetical protein
MKMTPVFIPTSVGQNGSTGQVKELPALLKKHSGKEIIFCENGLSFKDIIQQCRTLPPDARIRISAHRSQSIAGSEMSL